MMGDPEFELGFYIELMKIAQVAGMNTMMPTGGQKGPQVPAITAMSVAGQQAQSGTVPMAPMNAGALMGTGPNMSQFSDMAAGPTSRGPQPGQGPGKI